ncbi:unnamed protein product [Musa acuminata subsp. malaccensis]|uniref:(wild Malaysian banana) hypothetical protein n=1 Tax=Musa acuminata subsp. malaccensis TaxID=214687 RepID=A0A804JDU0_MUSAM|nr:unnamed protein product [Musa acuminata subsp. malaccensis]
MASTTPSHLSTGQLLLMGNHGRRHHHHISSFNPSWCFRPSPTKETPKRATPNDRIPTTASFPSLPKQKRLFRLGSMSVALSSPRIGCMGQIKRDRSASRDSTSSSSSSSKTSGSSSRERGNLLKITMALLRRSASDPTSSRVGGAEDDGGVVGAGVTVADMDPPLPVVRRVAARDELSVSLWERRCGGGERRQLKLQLPQQQPPRALALISSCN